MADLHDRLARIEGLILDVDGVLTDGRLYFGADGEAMKAYGVRDGLGLVLLREHGFRLGIVSGRASGLVTVRAEELRIDPVLLARTDKSAALDETLAAWNLSADRVAAIGDDIIDLPLLRRVGVSFAPGDADPRVLDAVDQVLGNPGGGGAVRERRVMLERWADTIADDPFYNPNLTLEIEDFGLARESRAPRPWQQEASPCAGCVRTSVPMRPSRSRTRSSSSSGTRPTATRSRMPSASSWPMGPSRTRVGSPTSSAPSAARP